MGQPVVHFEIIGKDGDALKRYYGELFGWRIDSGNPMDYGIVAREENLAPDGSGIGGGVGISRGTPGRRGDIAAPPVTLPVAHSLEGFAHAEDAKPGERDGVAGSVPPS